MWRCLSDDANWCCCEKFVRVDEETEKKNLFLIGQLGKCRVTKECSKLNVLNPKCYYLFLKGKSSFLTVNSPSKTTEFSVQLLFDFNTPVGTASQLPFFFFTVFLHLLFSFFLSPCLFFLFFFFFPCFIFCSKLLTVPSTPRSILLFQTQFLFFSQRLIPHLPSSHPQLHTSIMKDFLLPGKRPFVLISPMSL